MIKVNVRNGQIAADITFPCSEKDLSKALEKIDAADIYPPVLTVREVVFPDELTELEGQDIDLDELNFLAKFMDSFDAKEETRFFAAAACEGFSTPKELINLGMNLSRYSLIGDISDVSKIGWTYMLETKGALPASDRENPKYAEIGRQLMSSGKGIYTDHGLLFIDENQPMQELYDGRNFPFYAYESDMLLMVKAKYKGRTEYLCMPCEDAAITKAMNRLGAPLSDEVTVTVEDCSFDSPEWFDRIKGMAKTDRIYDINALSEALNNADQNFAKLDAVMEYADVSDAASIAALANSINHFIHIDDAQDLEDVGRFFIDNTPEYGLNPDLEDFFDYEKFGEHMDDENCGRFVSEGYVCMDSDHTLEEILDTDRGMKMGGM